MVEFVRSALDVVRRRWRFEDVFRCVKTELLLPLDGSITREDMDALENYVLACGIQGYRWTDGRSWKGFLACRWKAADRWMKNCLLQWSDAVLV